MGTTSALVESTAATSMIGGSRVGGGLFSERSRVTAVPHPNAEVSSPTKPSVLFNTFCREALTPRDPSPQLYCLERF